MNLIDSILNVDYVKLCDRCHGVGYLEIKNFDTLEPNQEVCIKCKGTGRLRVNGVLKVEPFKLDIAINDQCQQQE